MMLMCKHALLPRQPPFHDFIIGIARVSFYKTFWCRFLGKACFLSGDCTRAEASYREALGLQKDALPAWKGLAELYSSTGSTAADARETFEQLVRFLPEAMAMLDCGCRMLWAKHLYKQDLLLHCSWSSLQRARTGALPTGSPWPNATSLRVGQSRHSCCWSSFLRLHITGQRIWRSQQMHRCAVTTLVLPRNKICTLYSVQGGVARL